MTSFETVLHFLPELVLVVAATLIYLSGAFFNRTTQPTLLALLTLGGLLMIMGSQDRALPELAAAKTQGISGPLYIDAFGQTARWFILTATFLLVLLTRRAGNDPQRAEYTGSLLLLAAGLMICARANELVLLFCGLELVSIPTYVLLYVGRRGAAGQEATVKYFFLSILSSALLLYGFSFLYGVTGTTELRGMSEKLISGDGVSTLAALGMLLVVAGLGFRLTAVPFHFYAPDVYQGAGHASAGLLSTMPKVAGIMVLIRVVGVSLPGIEQYAWKVLLAVSVVTMTLGNVLALWQKNIRRLMAYSSIAHGGYLLIGAAVGLYQQSSPLAGDVNGYGSSLFYVAVYTFATIGFFAVLTSLENGNQSVETVDDLSGLARKNPWPALALAVFLFSMAGIPPLAGFWGKFNLILGSVQAVGFNHDGWQLWFLTLSIIAVLNAAVAAAYYLRLVAAIYFGEPASEFQPGGNPGPKLAWVLCLLLVVGTGLSADAVYKRAQTAGVQVARSTSLPVGNPTGVVTASQPAE